MGFWHLIFGYYGGGEPPEQATTRLTLRGTSMQRLSVVGTSTQRVTVTGTSEKRTTLRGSS